MKQKKLRTRVMFPIGAKLVIIITILFILSLGAVITMVSVLSTQEVQKTAEDNNFTVNHRAASQAEGSLKSVQAAVLLYLEMTDMISAEFSRNPEMERYFFNNNRNIAAIGVTGRFNGFIPNLQFFNSTSVNIGDAEAYMASDFPADEDNLLLFNASPFFNRSLIAVVFVRHGKAEDETIKVLFTPDDLSESFGTGTNTSFLINSSGELMLHPDNDLVLGGANFSAMPIVAIMQQQGDNHRQVSYNDGEADYFGAYYRLSGTDAAVITTIPHDIVFEAIKSITRQNMFLAAAVLFVAIIFIWFFSKTISTPVKNLAAAALQIVGGEFETHLKYHTRDELGLLTESFDKMSSALNIFGRFTNKDIAVRAMRGEIKPGGFPRHATVFFSDIRGFTEKAENFTKVFGEDASNRLVLWLNDYFTHMIHCVEKTGGVVDKFIGDAVMAHWGTAQTSGSPAEDAYNCVKSALMMRDALIIQNAARAKNDQGNPAIRIGCGINSGIVTSGQIGSEQRMEYTVIGDAVNLASRVESLNKPFGTDILISEDTWKLTGDKFVTEEMLPVKVKGKEHPVRVFAVINFKDTGGAQTLEQVRTLLGIETPDLNEANREIKEIKYNIYNVSSEKIDYKVNESSKPGASWKLNASEKPGAMSKEPFVIMTSFGSSALVQGQSGKLVPVFFSWNKSNFTEDIHVIVEVAEDQDFSEIVEDREVLNTISVSIPLKEGKYWWRVYPVHNGSREPVCSGYPCGVLMVDTNAKDKIQIR